MKHHSTTVLVAVIVAIATFLITNSMVPRVVMAPSEIGAPTDSTVTALNIVSIIENSSTTPTIAVEYPQFSSLPSEFNAEINSSVAGRLSDFRTTVSENMTARKDTALPGESFDLNPSAYSFYATWQPAQMNARYVSFLERFNSFVGGANEIQEMVAYNYDVVNKRAVTLSDLAGTSTDYLSKISNYVRGQLRQSLEANGNGIAPEEMLSAGTAAKLDNFKYFTFTDSVITFYFPKYAVAPGSFGEQKVSMPRSLIR